LRADPTETRAPLSREEIVLYWRAANKRDLLEQGTAASGVWRSSARSEVGEG
jgi:hypothetical protein